MNLCQKLLSAALLMLNTSCSILSYRSEDYAGWREQLAQTKPVPLKKEQFQEQMNRMSFLEAIVSVSTPEQAVQYVTEYLSYQRDPITYGADDYAASLRRIHERKKDDCDGGAVAAAALLSDDYYKLQMLFLKRKESSHLVFLLERENGTYGCISINKYECVVGDACRDLDSLLKFLNEENKYQTYKIIDVTEYRDELCFGNGDLSFIDKLLSKAESHLIPRTRVAQ